jgi:protein-disulfide isomerase
MPEHSEQGPAPGQAGGPPPAGRGPQAAEAEVPLRGLRPKRLALLAVPVLAAIVAVVVLTSGGSSSIQPASATPLAEVKGRINALLAGIPEDGNALGSPDAPVTLQFFGDLECPTSREFTIGALPLLIRKWVRSGKLRIEYRSLKTATLEPTVFTAQQVAALAAGEQERLWYYLELFYHEQGAEDSGYVTEAYLQDLAELVPGLDLQQWATSREDPHLAAQVAADESAAASEGFASTPSFLIGRTGARDVSKVLQFSVLDPAAFNTAIEQLLRQPGSAAPHRALATFIPSDTSRVGGLEAPARYAHLASVAPSGAAQVVGAVGRTHPDGGGGSC